MLIVLAVSLAAVLIALAAIHVLWAVRGATGGSAVPSRTDGTPIFRPTRLASLSVAAALLVAAYLVLARAGMIVSPVPANLIRIGTWMVAAAFALRTVGEFRYVGLFRRVRDTPFATWDAMLFTPLTFAIAVGVGAVAAS